jgi:PadR family transcriptional regulator, regulatory protein PadR
MNDKRRGEAGGNPRSVPTSNDIAARPKNWLVPVTLGMLSQASSYGYDIMERAVEFGFEAVNPGTVYRTLRKMEKDGLCESEWETNSSSGGPPRRVYSITDAGGAYLDLWVRSMEQYQQTMDDFLLAYKRGMSRS